MKEVISKLLLYITYRILTSKHENRIMVDNYAFTSEGRLHDANRLDTMECKANAPNKTAHVPHDVNPHILRMLEDTFCLTQPFWAQLRSDILTLANVFPWAPARVDGRL